MCTDQQWKPDRQWPNLPVRHVHEALHAFASKGPTATTGMLVNRHILNQHPQTPRVLIVEDNIINQKVTSGILKKLACEPTIVADGKEALLATEDNDYDLILMDCQMPVMDGFEATRQIRAGRTNNKNVPIVAITAGAFPGHRERCLEVGMDDYLSKPVRIDSLREILFKYLAVS